MFPYTVFRAHSHENLGKWDQIYFPVKKVVCCSPQTRRRVAWNCHQGIPPADSSALLSTSSGLPVLSVTRFLISFCCSELGRTPHDPSQTARKKINPAWWGSRGAATKKNSKLKSHRILQRRQNFSHKSCFSRHKFRRRTGWLVPESTVLHRTGWTIPRRVPCTKLLGLHFLVANLQSFWNVRLKHQLVHHVY